MLKRLIFWEFPRGGWQYDVVVGLILAFIFLTPPGIWPLRYAVGSDWFGDQPRIAKASNIAMISSKEGVSAFYIEPVLLNGIADDQRNSKVEELLRTRTRDKRLNVTDVEPQYDSEGKLQGYMAFARR